MQLTRAIQFGSMWMYMYVYTKIDEAPVVIFEKTYGFMHLHPIYHTAPWQHWRDAHPLRKRNSQHVRYTLHSSKI